MQTKEKGQNSALQYLRQHFPGDKTSFSPDRNPLPPYSPDLNPADYFLWGYLKNRVYADNPRRCEELKQNRPIRREIRRIPEDMLTRFVYNFSVCVPAVIQQRGAWIEHYH